MYYIKKKFEDGSTINVELEDSTVYSKCLFCGKEVERDLVDLIDNGFDFEGSNGVCEDCSKIFHTFKHSEEVTQNEQVS